MEFTYFAPLRIHFGCGKLDELAKLTLRNGNRILLVTGRKHLKETGKLDYIMKLFERSPKTEELVHFSNVTENPDSDAVDQAASLINQKRLNVVVAIGGGSAMDLAKAAALAAKQRCSIWDLVGNITPAMDAYPVVCSPTTSGSGSEVTRYSVINNIHKRLKVAIASEAIYPKVSLIDPSLTYTMSDWVKANTGFDALSHAIEAYTSRSACPITDGYCRQAISLIRENLRASIDGKKKAMDNMSLAAMLAGMALNVGRASLPHAMEHALSAYNRDLPHGRGLAMVMIPFLKRAIKCAPERFADIAYLMGKNISNMPLEKAAELVVDAVCELKDEVGLNDRLSQWGFDKDLINEMVENTFHTMEHGIANSPCTFDKEEIKRMYLEIL